MTRFVVEYDRPADPAAFEQHYREVHVPLARELPGLERFTVSQGVRALQGSAPYLIAELWFADQETLFAALGSEQGRAVGADAAGMDVELRTFTYEDDDVTTA